MPASNEESRDARAAYALLRLFFGVNIAMHGISRLLAGPAMFQGKLEAQFAHSPLPHAGVVAFGLILPWVEAVLGLCLLLGFRTRLALIGGGLLMVVLTFGSSLLQDWQIAGVQLIYAIAYAALLFLRRWNGYSLDSVLRSRGSA